MRPAEETRAWRKGLRAASKGLGRGRRATHQVLTMPGRRSRRAALVWRLLAEVAEQRTPADELISDLKNKAPAVDAGADPAALT